MPAEQFVILNVRYLRDGDRWIGECEELGTATQAATFDALQEELTELIRLHLTTLERQGERERFFRRRRIKMYREPVPARVRRSVPVVRGDQAPTEVGPVALAVAI